MLFAHISSLATIIGGMDECFSNSSHHIRSALKWLREQPLETREQTEESRLWRAD